MEEQGWTRYFGVLLFLSALIAVVSINPLGVVQFPTSFSFPSFEKATKLETLARKYREGCPRHQFTAVKRISRVPDMILIEGFLTKDEADILVELAYDILLLF